MRPILKSSFLFIVAILCVITVGCSGKSENSRTEAAVYTNLYQENPFKGVAASEWAFKGGGNEIFGQVLTTGENTYFSSAEKLYAVDTATGEKRSGVIV